MRTRNVIINVRVDKNEKQKLMRNAKKCGLNLSSYLRNLGLKQEIYAIPDKDFYKVYLQISELKSELYKLNKDEIERKMSQIECNFLKIYNSSKWKV